MKLCKFKFTLSSEKIERDFLSYYYDDFVIRYVDDMAEVVVDTSEDVIRLCDQGNRILKLTSNNDDHSKKYSNFN